MDSAIPAGTGAATLSTAETFATNVLTSTGHHSDVLNEHSDFEHHRDVLDERFHNHIDFRHHRDVLDDLWAPQGRFRTPPEIDQGSDGWEEEHQR